MIKTILKQSSIMPAIALALLIVIGSPSIASARPGNDSREANVSTNQMATTDGATVADDSQMSTTNVGTAPAKTETGSERRESVKASGEARVKQLRAERKTNTTAEKREKVCETRKNGLETKFASLTRNAVRYQAKVDGVFNKLPMTAEASAPEEFAAAVLAKEKSEASVKALGEVKLATTVDCKNTNVAAQVASFKVAASTARDDLKDYKMAVKDVLKALKSATPKPAESAESTEVKN